MVDVGSWAGMIGRLLLGRMDLGSLFVQDVRLVFLSVRLLRGEISLGRGKISLCFINLH